MTIELTKEERKTLAEFQDQNLDDPWVGQKALDLKRHPLPGAIVPAARLLKLLRTGVVA